MIDPVDLPHRTVTRRLRLDGPDSQTDEFDVGAQNGQCLAQMHHAFSSNTSDEYVLWGQVHYSDVSPGIGGLQF
jgi:hypothetical protein